VDKADAAGLTPGWFTREYHRLQRAWSRQLL